MVKLQVQIIPVAIGLFNQVYLPRSLPGFDLILACFCRITCIMRFAPDETMDLVFACKRTPTPLAVLKYALCKIIGMTTVQSAVLTITEKIDPEFLFHPPASLILRRNQRRLVSSSHTPITNTRWTPASHGEFIEPRRSRRKQNLKLSADPSESWGPSPIRSPHTGGKSSRWIPACAGICGK